MWNFEKAKHKKEITFLGKLTTKQLCKFCGMSLRVCTVPCNMCNLYSYLFLNLTNGKRKKYLALMLFLNI